MKLRPIFLALWMIMLLSMGSVFLTVSLSAQDASLSAAEDSRFGVMSHLSWGFLYDSEAYKVDAFTACDSYLRKLSHKGKGQCID